MNRLKGLRRYSYDTEETSFDIHSEGVEDCERHLSHINGSSITHIDKYVACGRVNAIELHLSSGADLFIGHLDDYLNVVSIQNPEVLDKLVGLEISNISIRTKYHPKKWSIPEYIGGTSTFVTISSGATEVTIHWFGNSCQEYTESIGFTYKIDNRSLLSVSNSRRKQAKIGITT